MSGPRAKDHAGPSRAAFAAQAARRGLPCALALLALWGCPSREFYRQDPEVAWESHGIKRVELPAFEATPDAWAVADSARQSLMAALGRGTVEVVEAAPQATLKGAVASYVQSTTPSSPRRVTQNTSTGVAYVWEMDVTNAVSLRLALRLLGPRGNVLWSKETYGTDSETAAVTLNWPGNDPVTPPAILPAPVDPRIFERLRERALRQALSPLVDALTVHYGYRNLE
jgi:hypothetical protein